MFEASLVARDSRSLSINATIAAVAAAASVLEGCAVTSWSDRKDRNIRYGQQH